MNYIVMETNLSYAVVLDEKGRFKKVANLNYEVGQKINDVYEMKEIKEEFYLSKKMFATLATLAAVFVFVFSLIFDMPMTPYASIYFSINPEVRIDVNKNNEVINLKGMNDDGKDLILNYNYKDKNLDKVSDDLIDKAIDMGYLYDGRTISISFEGKDSEWIATTKNEYSKHINNYLQDKVSVTIKFDDEDSYEIIIPVNNNQFEDNHYGDSDYDDSDYGPNNDGVTDYDDSDYNPNSDDVTDYSDYNNSNNDSNYGSDYNNSDYDDSNYY